MELQKEGNIEHRGSNIIGKYGGAVYWYEFYLKFSFRFPDRCGFFQAKMAIKKEICISTVSKFWNVGIHSKNKLVMLGLSSRTVLALSGIYYIGFG